MANKPKIGLEYFPLEVDFFDDIKIRKLIKYQGCKATPVYTLLLCNIYRNGYYMRWDEELPFMISEKTGYEEAFVREVIKCCFQVDLFSKKVFENHRVLTSKGIQERYGKICWMLKRKLIVTEFMLIPSEEIPISSEEMVNSPEDIPNSSELIRQRKGKETKVKETKVKETKRKEREGKGEEDKKIAPAPIDKNSFLTAGFAYVEKNKRRLYPMSCARCETEILKLQDAKKWTKEADEKIFERYLGRQIKSELEHMWNWHAKKGLEKTIVDWKAAIEEWFQKEFFKEKLS